MTPVNVGALHVICSATLGGPINFQTGPIVVHGILYATRANQTFALNAATCGRLWVNTYATTNLTQQTRGLAYANGLLFRGLADGHVIAINATTGATVWNQQIIASGSYEIISAAPIVWNGTLILGTSNGDAAEVCHVFALAQTTGKLLWSQQTVPSLTQPAASTWKGAAFIAGGSMWTSFTIDPSIGRLYVPVGNPEADFDVRRRLGSNLYTDSVLQFNSTTGALENGVQLIAQDDHDWDQGATPAIVTPRNSAKVALVAGKYGYLRSIDLSTLKQRWQTPVTRIENPIAPIAVSGTHYCPWGAVLWNGPAYSSATGLAYVNSNDWCATVELSATPQPAVPGKLWTGSSNSFGRHDATKSGWLRAVDAVTGTQRWQYHATLPLLAGVTPTAGGLVFTGDLLGNVLAFNAASGALLATVPIHSAVGGGVISYEISGTQYVAVAAGLSSGTFQTPDANAEIVVLGL
jgi:alcohol dehydrogenase (cytochrome c)